MGNAMIVVALEASTLNIQKISGDVAALHAEGASSLEVAMGDAKNVEVQAFGTVSVKLHDLSTSTATIQASGSSTVEGMTAESVSALSNGRSQITTSATGKVVTSCEGFGSVAIE